MTTEPPQWSSGLIAPAMAFLWKSGTAASARSPGPEGQCFCSVRIHQSCPAWVSTTPFGLPVEPDV